MIPFLLVDIKNKSLHRVVETKETEAYYFFTSTNHPRETFKVKKGDDGICETSGFYWFSYPEDMKDFFIAIDKYDLYQKITTESPELLI